VAPVSKTALAKMLRVALFARVRCMKVYVVGNLV